MIRLRPLRPREKRNLRHWAMELLVVVLGVLIALWAAEWAEGRRTKAALAEYETAIRNELSLNYALTRRHASMLQCYREFSSDLQRQLRASEGRWRGFGSSFGETAQDGSQRPYGIVGVFPNYLQTTAWETAREAGVLSAMPLDRLQRYQFAYQVVDFVNTGVGRVEDKRDALSGLIFEGPLAPQTRSEALRDLASFNNGVQRLGQSERLADPLMELEIGVNEAGRRILEQTEEYVQEEEGEEPCLSYERGSLPDEVGE